MCGKEDERVVGWVGCWCVEKRGGRRRSGGRRSRCLGRRERRKGEGVEEEKEG